MKRVFHTCANCGKNKLKTTEIARDHIIPVRDPKTDWTTWDAYIEGLLPEDSNRWQKLCHPCHNKKTLLEDAERLEYARKKKEDDL